jgi:hypothetical protein
MGIELGSVIVWDYKYWLFAGYTTDQEHKQRYRLHGLNGKVVEPLEGECSVLIEPSEMRE